MLLTWGMKERQKVKQRKTKSQLFHKWYWLMVFCLQTCCCVLLLLTYNNHRRMQERPAVLNPPLSSLTQYRHKWGEFTHNKSWRRQAHAVASDEQRLHMHKPVCEWRVTDREGWNSRHTDDVIMHTDEQLTVVCRCRQHQVSYGSRLWLRKWMDHLHA